MELVERDKFLEQLQASLRNVSRGEGHSLFISGEAGIGKTSLVKVFCNAQRDHYNIYQGACDALFAQRPLAPLNDILWQVDRKYRPHLNSSGDRYTLFADFFSRMSDQTKVFIIVFEDIHWADEATLDFIKFFARRISLLRCLFILTFRDDDVSSQHPLRNILGQLPPDSFTRIRLTPLSKTSVMTMATERGFSGEEVYNICGGNPFYVKEVLASYHSGIPENIKDSIMSVFNRQAKKTKLIWEFLSVAPNRLEVKYLKKFDPSYATVLERSLESKILVIEEGYIYFKHEIFRRTVESFITEIKRISLNKKVMSLLLSDLDETMAIERIIHHAKNAKECDIVVHYAPIAARHAALLGAHVEAKKLFLTAIEYYQGSDKDVLIDFYESYAYECYLTNFIKEAIIYNGRALHLWKEKNDAEKIGNCLRFSSRLWWFIGARRQAETFGKQAIKVLDKQPASRAKAMAFSNMSQLKMLSDELAECVTWGEKAIEMARELDDQETLSHALNNVGTTYMRMESGKQKGLRLLEQSLQIALRNSFHEHVARAYTNLSHATLHLKDYKVAEKVLREGLSYCEKRDLDSWSLYMLSTKAKLNLETGDWEEALRLAQGVLKNENLSPVSVEAKIVVGTIKLRKGDSKALSLLLEAKDKAFETLELQNIVPALTSLLEYEWITGKNVLTKGEIEHITVPIDDSIHRLINGPFAFWLLKARKERMTQYVISEGYDVSTVAKAQMAAFFWKELGCPYMQAIVLFEGTDEDKRKAVLAVQEMGATAIFEKLKSEMRLLGIKSIPRGIRKSTRSNPAFLTPRELELLPLLKEGLQNKEIGARLFISPKTVDHHISSLFFKLNVNTRAQAVAEAVRIGIMT